MLPLLLIAMACGARDTSAPEASTSAVVEAFLAARSARNLDATMDAFGQQPELRSSQGIYWSGRDAVRAIMVYRLQDTYTVSDRKTVGNRVTWTEHVARPIAFGAPPANFDEDVEATVVDGRIASLVTSLGGARALQLKETVPAPAEVPLSTQLLAPLSIVLIVLAILVWPPREAAPPRPSQTGHLLRGLRAYVDRRTPEAVHDA